MHGKAALEETFLRLTEEAGPAAKAAPWDEEGEDGQASEDGETTGIKLPHGFTITETGVYWREDNADGTPIRLCGPIEILASTRDSPSTAWGLLLRWRDEDGVVHEWAMPRKLLNGDGAEIRKKLLDEGLFIAAGQKARNKLSEFLLSVRVDARARCVDKIGWYGDAYVLPGSSFGATGEQVVLQTTSPPVFDIKGALEGWKQEVASVVIGNSRIAMAISAAFAGPLLKMAGETSFGLHFSGPSSIGKTLALRAATSVWGSPLRTWRVTDNEIEAWAAQSNDGLLAIDELSQVDARVAEAITYMLGNGRGKGRSTRDLTSRAEKEWACVFVSTGEIGLGEKLSKIGKQKRAGQDVRRWRESGPAFYGTAWLIAFPADRRRW